MKRFFVYLMLFGITVAVVGGSRLRRLHNNQAIYSAREIDLYLHKSIGLAKLSTRLVDSLQVAQSKEELQWAGQLLGWNSFKPGHYRIKGGSTYDQFLSKLALGSQDPISVTILPGRMQEEILSTLASSFRFDSVAVHAAINDSAFLAKYNITPRSAVGHLYPETYQFYWTKSAKGVLNEIFHKFDEAIQPFKDRLKKKDKSLDEILTLASIVEWEAAQDSTKAKISGLYWNRLQRDMLLQADPTVIYAIGKHRRLTFEDYEIKDPYNTYIHPGLPPGPVTNPDLKSIKAALFPADHDYIYMVAKPGGGHAFSKTYAQHQRKAEEWREWLQKQVQIKERRQNNNS